MSTPIGPVTSRTDIVSTESAPRPTPTPVRVSFKQVMANAAAVAGRTAESAATLIPGGAMLSTALRGPAAQYAAGPMSQGGAGLAAAEGPVGSVGSALGSSTAGAAGDPQAALAAAHTNEMEMLALQQQVNSQQNSFTLMSNLLKSESDTEKSAINNIK